MELKIIKINVNLTIFLGCDKISEATAQFIRLNISDQVRNGKLFSVSMDTTFDNSKKEQLSFVI